MESTAKSARKNWIWIVVLGFLLVAWGLGSCHLEIALSGEDHMVLEYGEHYMEPGG